MVNCDALTLKDGDVINGDVEVIVPLPRAHSESLCDVILNQHHPGALRNCYLHATWHCHLDNVRAVSKQCLAWYRLDVDLEV